MGLSRSIFYFWLLPSIPSWERVSSAASLLPPAAFAAAFAEAHHIRGGLELVLASAATSTDLSQVVRWWRSQVAPVLVDVLVLEAAAPRPQQQTRTASERLLHLVTPSSHGVDYLRSAFNNNNGSRSSREDDYWLVGVRAGGGEAEVLLLLLLLLLL